MADQMLESPQRSVSVTTRKSAPPPPQVCDEVRIRNTNPGDPNGPYETSCYANGRPMGEPQPADSYYDAEDYAAKQFGVDQGDEDQGMGDQGAAPAPAAPSGGSSGDSDQGY